MSIRRILPSRTWPLTGVGVLLVTTVLVAWSQRSALESARSTYQTKRTQLVSMQADARRLEYLRTAPQRATDRRLPHEQLAAEIEEACQRAAIPTQALASIWPDAPRRLPQSDYQELSTRLSFEQVNLQQMAAFVHHLQTIDPSLSLAEFRLTGRRGDTAGWDVELSISYLVFAPVPASYSAKA